MSNLKFVITERHNQFDWRIEMNGVQIVWNCSVVSAGGGHKSAVDAKNHASKCGWCNLDTGLIYFDDTKIGKFEW